MRDREFNRIIHELGVFVRLGSANPKVKASRLYATLSLSLSLSRGAGYRLRVDAIWVFLARSGLTILKKINESTA